MNKLIYFSIFTLLVSGCGSPKPKEEVKQKAETKRDYLKEGVALLKKRDLKEAVISFNRAIQQDPTDVEPHLILGKLYIDGGKYAEAVKHFEAVGELQPDNGKIFLTLAKCYEQMNDLEKAINSAKRSALIFKAKNETEHYRSALAIVGILMKVAEQADEKDMTKDNLTDDNIKK